MADEIKTTSRKPRRALRWLGIIVGVLVLLLVVAYFVATSEWALKSVILPKVSKAANAQVTVESANISPFSSVGLRGLRVQTTGTEPLVTAKEVRLRYSLMDIIKGNINVSEVTLDSPVVNLVTFPDGTSNLDPITKQPKEAKPKAEPKEKKSEKPPQVNLQKLALNNATVRVVEQHKDGTKKLTELTGVTVTADDIGNDKTGQLGLAANVRMDQGLNTSSNGVLAAIVGGKFNFTLDSALNPKVVKGETKVDVTEAKGAFAQAAGSSVVLNADLTPTQLNDVSVRLAQSGKNLGALTVSGPFSAETMEGKLAANISQIDRQALNIVGAAMGLDFNQTTIGSTNTIELTQRGRMIAINGAVIVGNFSATQKGQTTPVLDVRTAYSVNYDQTNRTALLQTFALNGTQNNAEFLRGTLAKPMLINLGNGTGAMDESALDLVLTSLNLPDWRPFIPTNVNLASGQVGANLKLLSRQSGKDLSVTGRATVNDLTASVQSNRFDRFATAVDVDIGMRGSTLDIRKVIGTLQQSGQPGGAFDVTGNYDLSNKTGLITAKITDLNQNALKSFLAAALGDKQLESITINANTTAKLDGPTDMSVKTEVHVANLVVNDPSGQVPKTPLGLDAIADVSSAKNVIDLRQVQLALAKTERAPNSLNVVGRIDMSKSNAWTGNVKVTSEGLDVTPYYDLFAGNKSKQTSATTTTTETPQPPTETKPETEPPPMTLPFTQFAGEVNIAKFFLREVAISNLVSKTTIENGRVNVNPFTLTLNGAPVSLIALANVGVPGYEYDVNATLDHVPVEPLANTFAPAQRGIYKGEIVSSIRFKGAGLTGRNIQRNLGGAVGFVLTNAEVKISDARFENRYLGWLVKWAPLVAKYLQVPEMADSPVSLVDAQAGITNGILHLRRAFIESPAFQASVPGTITLNEVMTNSALNKLPLQLALRRSVAEKARLAPPGSGESRFVELPSFVSIEGTVGKPKYDLNERAVLQLIAKAAGGFIKGDAGTLLRNLGNLGTGGTTTGTNSPASTNAPATNATQNLLRGLGGLLNKPAGTNTATTNAPADKKGGFKLNDLLK